MDNATRLTNLEVTGDLEVKGKSISSGLTKATYLITSDSAAAAAGSEPTAAEFKKVVDLVNEIKTDYNKLVNQLCTGSDTGS